MTKPRSRRQFLARTAGLAAGVATFRLLRPTPSLAQPSVTAAQLVDAGDTLRAGSVRGAAVVDASAGAVVQATSDGGIFTSAVLRSPMRFTHVGLHYAAAIASPAGCNFELRTSSDGVTWSPWRQAHLECLPQETPVGDYFCNLVYARDAQFVQYRATFRSGGGVAPVLQRVTATVIASPVQRTEHRLLTVTVEDPVSGRTLAVTPRELWLADERYRFNERGEKVWNEMFVPAKKLVVHHTATRNDYENVDEAAAEVRAIYYFHAVTRAWGDIGYNALVDKFGNLYEGRHGRGEGVSREVLSAGVVAGHDLHHNYGSAGVALVGDATAPDWPMTDAAGPMWDTLVRYSVFESGRHFLRPLAPGAARQRSDADIAASDFLRSDDVWTEAMRNVSGHRETFDTLCPGDVVMALLGELRNAIHAGLAGTSRTGVLLTTAGRQTTLEGSISYHCEAEAPEAGWRLVGFEYSIEGWFRPRGSEDIDYLSGYTEGAQPRPAWTRVETPGPWLKIGFDPVAAGHYTLHVQAVLEQGSGKQALQRPSAYEGNHTYLVQPADSAGRDTPAS